MVSMALALRGIPLDRIAFVHYPSSPSTVHGQSVTLQETGDAAILMQALAADQAVVTTQLGGAAVATSGGKPSGSPSPTPSPTPAGGVPVPLPTTISGQAADQSTCSTGQNG